MTHPNTGRGTGPRPHIWLSGPDPERHEQYTQWLRQRAQASFRQEPWALTFEEFVDIWSGSWHLRGRYSEDLCMTREDPDGAWTAQNVRLITRHDHALRSMAIRMARGQTRGYKKRLLEQQRDAS